jgi:hypothetical protein
VLKNASKDPDGCASLTSSRIDILEFKGDPSSLEKVGSLVQLLGFLAMGLHTNALHSFPRMECGTTYLGNGACE